MNLNKKNPEAPKKTAMFAWYGYIEPYQKRIEHIKKAGFDGISLWWEPEKYCTCREMVIEAGNLNLDIVHVHMNNAPNEDLATDSQRRNFIAKIKHTIKEMTDEDLHHLVIHICDKTTDTAPSAAYLHDIENLIAFAEREKTILSLENTYSIKYLTTILDCFPSPYVGLCYDTSHGALGHHEKLLNNYGNRLTACHISDNNGLTDDHALPLDGTVNFQPLMEAISYSKADYTLEVIAKTPLYPNPEEFTKEAFHRLNKIISK